MQKNRVSTDHNNSMRRKAVIRVRTDLGKPGKSWNLILTFSRTGKSWKKTTGSGKSWKSVELVR